MAAFEEENNKTTEKMADLVMEYASQFVASDYYEEYMTVSQEDASIFVPNEFDEKFYQKIVSYVNSRLGGRRRTIRMALLTLAAILLLGCVGFTIFSLLNETMRTALVLDVLKNI